MNACKDFKYQFRAGEARLITTAIGISGPLTLEEPDYNQILGVVA